MFRLIRPYQKDSRWAGVLASALCVRDMLTSVWVDLAPFIAPQRFWSRTPSQLRKLLPASSPKIGGLFIGGPQHHRPTTEAGTRQRQPADGLCIVGNQAGIIANEDLNVKSTGLIGGNRDRDVDHSVIQELHLPWPHNPDLWIGRRNMRKCVERKNVSVRRRGALVRRLTIGAQDTKVYAPSSHYMQAVSVVDSKNDNHV